MGAQLLWRPGAELSPTGGHIFGFGSSGTGAGQFGGAAGLAISGGNLYVAEWSNQRVQEFSPGGHYLGAFDQMGTGNGKSSLPFAIATDPGTGNLYVSELGGDRVQEFGPSGGFITAFGSAGSGAGQLSFPRGIAAGTSGLLYVVDTGNDRMQEWAPSE